LEARVIIGQHYDSYFGLAGDTGLYYVVDKGFIPAPDNGNLVRTQSDGTKYFATEAYLCVAATGTSGSYSGITGSSTYVVPFVAIQNCLEYNYLLQSEVIQGQHYDPLTGLSSDSSLYFVIGSGNIPFADNGLWYNFSGESFKYFLASSYTVLPVTGTTGSWVPNYTKEAKRIPFFSVNNVYSWTVTSGGGGGGTTGPQGPTGPASGPQGPQGIQGLQGNQGNQGVQGNQGNQGTGVQGAQGVQGLQGAQGNQGPQGDIGVQGSQGSGVQGAQGVTGVQGAQGVTGAQGVQGPTGASGALRYYGSFFDTSTQTNAGVTGANPMTFNTTDIANGISIVNNTEITVANPGVYNIQFSAQFDKTDSGNDNADIWLSKNGVNVSNSNTRIELDKNNMKLVAAWNWLVETTTSSEYFEIYWSSGDSDMRIYAEGGATGPIRPAIPSIILTVYSI